MMRRSWVMIAAALLAAPLCVAGTAATPIGAQTKNATTVTMRDCAFVIDGKLRPGQAEITVENPGKEAHILYAIKLKPGVTLEQVRKALHSEDESAFEKVTSDPDSAYGIPFILSPGGEATSTTSLFKVGTYAFDSIEVPPSPAPSSVTVKVENQGTTVHSLVIVKLNGSATIADVDAFFDSFEGGSYPADAPGEVLSGMGDIPPDASVYLTWNGLPPGRYGYASVSGGDEEGQGDDIDEGLYGEFTIE